MDSKAICDTDMLRKRMYTLNAWNGFFWLSSFLKLTTREIKRDMLHQKIHDELIKYIIPSTGMIKEVKIKSWGSCKVVIVFTIFTKL